MYEVDILENYKWKTVVKDEDIKVIDETLKELKESKPKEEVRVLENDRVVTFLHGLDRDYDYWNKTFIENDKNSIYQKIRKTRKY